MQEIEAVQPISVVNIMNASLPRQRKKISQKLRHENLSTQSGRRANHWLNILGEFRNVLQSRDVCKEGMWKIEDETDP